MGTLTVRENLNFSAALRLPESIPQSDKEQMVDKLIQELGLSRVANSKVRRWGGGGGVGGEGGGEGGAEMLREKLKV